MSELTAPLQPGLLLVLSAPSGAGKTTLAHRLLREVPDALFSVSHTTRRPRGFADLRHVAREAIDAGTLRREFRGCAHSRMRLKLR